MAGRCSAVNPYFFRISPAGRISNSPFRMSRSPLPVVRSCQQFPDGSTTLRRGPNRPWADVVLAPRVNPQRRVDGAEQVSFTNRLVFHLFAVAVGFAVHDAAFDA